MSRNTKKDKEHRNRAHRPLRNRDPQCFISSVRVPLGAIVANLAGQSPNNSYLPPLFYADDEVECIDCGVVETWTAEQQHWWYEIAKGPVDSSANRCRACRAKRREAQAAQRERSRAGSEAKARKRDQEER